MFARALSIGVVLALLGACGKPDNQPADADSAVPAATVEPAPLEPSPIVDMRVWDSGTRVCVLHAEGRVACAATKATELEPPLESLGMAVELTTSHDQLCVRGQQGPVRCLDEKGEVHEVEGLSSARSLEGTCAVNSTGGLFCWDESFVAKPAELPRLPYGELQHVTLLYEGLPLAGGCALKTDGELWCWLDSMDSLGVDLGTPVRSGGHADADTYAPVEITDVGDGSKVLELSASSYGVCWRLPSGWMCARHDASDPFPPPGRIDNVVEPYEQCDTHPCNCSFPCWEESCQPRDLDRKISCEVPQAGEQFVVDSHHMAGIVHFWAGELGQCVVDVNDRVWCQTPDQALHELVVRR